MFAMPGRQNHAMGIQMDTNHVENNATHAYFGVGSSDFMNASSSLIVSETSRVVFLLRSSLICFPLCET